MAKNPHQDAVLVVGIGRLGGSVATALDRLGHEVLAVDSNPQTVQAWAGRLTHVVEADATSEDAMRQIGATDFPFAVVGISHNIEASVLATSVLVDLGVPDVWAQADTEAQGRILERIGASHVFYPQSAMGERIAHLLTGKMIDYMEFDDGFAIVKTRAPREAVGRTLGESAMRTKHGVTIVGVKRPGADFTYARPETTVNSGDLLIVAGRTDLVEKFAAVL